MAIARHLVATRILALISLFLSMAGCTNPYAKFYTDLSRAVSVKGASFIETFNGEPEVLSGTNSDDEINQLSSNGWLAIGYSSFNAGKMAQTHARQVGAQMVIISSSYQGTVARVMPLTLPNTTTTYHSGTVTGYGGSAIYGGTSTTYGSTTSYIPYSVNRYQYVATYWVERKSGGWGVYCKDLTPEQRREAGTNKGVLVAISYP